MRNCILSMKSSCAIVNKELKGYFVSPIAYSVLCVITVISGIYFYMLLSNFFAMINQYQMYAQLYRNPALLERLNLNERVIAPFLQFLIIVLIFVVPALSMRLIAEEKKQKTDELLMTSPISTFNIVLGKFFGSFFFILLALSLTALFMCILFYFGNPELGPLVSGYIGLIFVATLLLSIGLFTSSLTSNQINAYFISFAIGLLLLIIGWASQLTSGAIGSVLGYLSITGHFANFAKGTLDLNDTLYFVSIIVFFIFLTKTSLESSKWR